MQAALAESEARLVQQLDERMASLVPRMQEQQAELRALAERSQASLEQLVEGLAAQAAASREDIDGLAELIRSERAQRRQADEKLDAELESLVAGTTPPAPAPAPAVAPPAPAAPAFSPGANGEGVTFASAGKTASGLARPPSIFDDELVATKDGEAAPRARARRSNNIAS